MKVFAVDGHPHTEGLAQSLLGAYLGALSGAEVTRIALRDLAFDPILHGGYKVHQPLEPDLERAAEALKAADHFVIAFPMWWGGQPALVKGFFDRLLLPGFAFKYRPNSSLWDGLLAGKSADALITGDTPRVFLRFAYGDPIVRQMRSQVLGFCGFRPVRVAYFAPVRRQGERRLAGYVKKATRLGASVPGRRP